MYIDIDVYIFNNLITSYTYTHLLHCIPLYAIAVSIPLKLIHPNCLLIHTNGERCAGEGRQSLYLAVLCRGLGSSYIFPHKIQPKDSLQGQLTFRIWQGWSCQMETHSLGCLKEAQDTDATDAHAWWWGGAALTWWGYSSHRLSSSASGPSSIPWAPGNSAWSPQRSRKWSPPAWSIGRWPEALTAGVLAMQGSDYTNPTCKEKKQLRLGSFSTVSRGTES